MRTLLGGLLSVAVISVLACTPNKPTPKQEEKKELDRAEQFQILKEDWERAVSNFQNAHRAAKTDADRKEALAKRPDPVKFNASIQKLIDADPKDDLALEILSFRVLRLQDLSAATLGPLVIHHAQNPKIADLVEVFADGSPDEMKTLLEKVLADNADRRAKGLACLALAVTAAQGEKEKSATVLFERIEKGFGDVKAGQRTLAELAKPYLFEVRNLAIGKKAPDVESVDLEGKKVKLSDHKDKVVVLDIWATWCPPCRAMIPHERDIVKKFKDKPFALISVSADDDKETVQAFIKKEPMPWVHWWAGDSGIVKDWNVRFFPTIYVIDAKGVIRYKNLRDNDLEEAVSVLVAEATAKKK